MRTFVLVLFLSVFFAAPALAQAPASRWEVAAGPHVVFRESSSATHAGGGVTIARRHKRWAGVLEGGGTRREGHNDWRIVAGPRLLFDGGTRPTFFVQALAGAAIRQNEADWAVLPGFGVDLWLSDSRAFRFQFDAPFERSESRTTSSIRASVWLVFH
jgi:hypothetical protein